MKLPRDLAGRELVRALGKAFGYQVTRETGSHLRLTTQAGGQHHLTIPDHDNLRVGTLAAVLGEVCTHFQLERADVVRRLFGE
jgi:predicted RNA binding protein YcfA (HicA-like mRNA interferase family)